MQMNFIAAAADVLPATFFQQKCVCSGSLQLLLVKLFLSLSRCSQPVETQGFRVSACHHHDADYEDAGRLLLSQWLMLLFQILIQWKT